MGQEGETREERGEREKGREKSESWGLDLNRVARLIKIDKVCCAGFC
jgi:hypothetical protein